MLEYLETKRVATRYHRWCAHIIPEFSLPIVLLIVLAPINKTTVELFTNEHKLGYFYRGRVREVVSRILPSNFTCEQGKLLDLVVFSNESISMSSSKDEVDVSAASLTLQNIEIKVVFSFKVQIL